MPEQKKTKKAKAKTSSKSQKHGRWEIGASYFIRTVTHYVTGKLVDIDDHELWLQDAAWIASTGRYADAVKSATLDEVEPYPDGEIIPVGRGAIIDGCRWNHPLPRDQK